MKITKLRFFLAFVFIFPLLLISSKTVSALSSPIIPRLPSEISKVKLVWGVRCTAVEKNVEKKIEKFEDNKEKHYERYTLLLDRLETKLEGWKEMGYDVDTLEADLDKLTEKVDKFHTDYGIYLDKLQAAKDITCDGTEADYISALQAAKTAIKNVRKDAVEIKTFYWNTIRKHILELKNQQITSEEE